MVLFQRLIFIVILLSWLTVSGLCEDICPSVAELHTPEKIVVEVNGTAFSELKSYIWRSPQESVMLCKTSESDCDSLRPGYSGTINGTISVLVIRDVTKSDSGLWTLLDTESSSSFDVCHLVTAQKPSCRIDTNIQADDLDLGANLTVTVNITGYHCSQTASFSLITEDVTQMTIQNLTGDTGTDFYDQFLNTTFDINLASLGDVILEFGCASRTWPLVCEGVRKLIKSKPQCNISSDNDTSVLDLGDELTLTVDIKGYYCPRPAGFNLTTGQVIDALLKSHEVHNITDVVRSTTFNITTTRFGDVRLHYTCDGDSWLLECGGVTALVQREPATTKGPLTTSTTTQDGSNPTPDSSSTSRFSTKTSTSVPTNTTTTSAPGLPIPLIAGVSGGLFLFIVLIVIVIANRRQLHRVAQKYIVERRKTPRPFMEDEIPAGVGPEVPKDGKADDIKLGRLELTTENHVDADDYMKKNDSNQG